MNTVKDKNYAVSASLLEGRLIRRKEKAAPHSAAALAKKQQAEATARWALLQEAAVAHALLRQTLVKPAALPDVSEYLPVVPPTSVLEASETVQKWAREGGILPPPIVPARLLGERSATYKARCTAHLATYYPALSRQRGESKQHHEARLLRASQQTPALPYLPPHRPPAEATPRWEDNLAVRDAFRLLQPLGLLPRELSIGALETLNQL